MRYCKECERFERHQIHVDGLGTRYLLGGNLADRERATVLSIVILNRLKDHQAIDHEPGVAYEGAPILH